MNRPYSKMYVPQTPKLLYPKFWETQSRMSNGVLKRGVGIIYDGFKFVEKQTMSKTTRTFRCQKHNKKCKVKVFTEIDYAIIRDNEETHNHDESNSHDVPELPDRHEVPNEQNTHDMPELWKTPSNAVGIKFKGFSFVEKKTKAKSTKLF